LEDWEERDEGIKFALNTVANFDKRPKASDKWAEVICGLASPSLASDEKIMEGVDQEVGDKTERVKGLTEGYETLRLDAEEKV
jgi:hypothetical protein